MNNLYKKITGMVLILSILYSIIGGTVTTNAATVINLSDTWKFAPDPNRIGITEQWYSDAFDDSAWQTILSGQSWESQGVDYAGYAWYRQKIDIPVSSQGAPLKIILASIFSDDDFYFNGVRIGGLKGEYKYNNRKLRTYTIPASSIRYGQSNTVAIRIWGGNIGFEGKKSGLVAGTYQAVLDHYRIMARPVGGTIDQEAPFEIWDLSNAQQGAAFELVYRFDPATIPGTPKDFLYTVMDVSRAPIITGTTPVTVSDDGIARAVISVDAAASQQIYLSGRFNIVWDLVEPGTTTPSWADTGESIYVYESPLYTAQLKIYRKTFETGTVSLPPHAETGLYNMYSVIVSSTEGLNVTNLAVNDPANATDWSVQSNLQPGDTVYGDRIYTFSSIPSTLLGKQWIRTANDSKSSTVKPVAAFSINQQADVYLAVDARCVKMPWENTSFVDNLSFIQRDTNILPALPDTFESTPYGSLKLVDRIDCSTSLDGEIHPYLQSSFSGSTKYNTPGANVDVSVNTILGKQAREINEYGWFSYRIGRGQLTPGSTYLLRIEYPEDKPRYCPVEIQVGQNYTDIGWRNGVSSTDVYDPWPLSNTWQYYDTIVPLGEETTSSGGTGDGNINNGFWVYFMNKIKPGFYFSPYEGGPAVASISLYEIDSAVNAPVVILPQGLPQRVLMFDWERQPTHVPADLVKYAKLMGYSAISPVILKWAFMNYGDPVRGYNSTNADDGNYWVSSAYVPGSGQTPPPAVPGKPSVHQQYLSATHNSGIDYIPRFEYGGSYDLPESAHPIGSNGAEALPNRFANWGANLLNTATWNDLKTYMDSLILPYAAVNPQLKGALWRSRCERMQISYGPDDIALFCSETATASPSGLTNEQLARWASTGDVGDDYTAWWHGKRTAFHQQLVNLMKSYRSDMTLYYFNWDTDKFSMMNPDLNQWAFISQIETIGGPAAYAQDRAARETFTAADYINCIQTGDFTGSIGKKRPDLGLLPSLYSNLPGIQLLAPSEWLCYTSPEYLNYFRTNEGLAVSNCVSYDEIASRYINPRYETNMVLPGGGPYSMALELLAYYHGDARTLTYTSYTYGRGFADMHRRFAQAFRALPAVPGAVVEGTPADTKVRTYPTVNGTYIGIAYKGYTANPLTIDIPGIWNQSMTVRNLVTNEVIPTVIVNGKLQINMQSGPMELNAFLVANSTPQAPISPAGLSAVAGVGKVSMAWTASSEAEGYNVKRAAVSGGPYETIAMNVAETSYTDSGLTNGTTYYYVVSAINTSGESADSVEAVSLPQPTPSAPTGLTATAGADQAVLSWTASVGAESYNVKRALQYNGPYVTVASGITETGYTDTGLTGDVTYYYVVSAVSSIGESADSAQTEVIPIPVPMAPDVLTVTAGIGQAILDWSAVNGAESYNIKRSTVSGGPYTEVASCMASSSYIDTGLTVGMTYYYVVAAVNSNNIEGSDSAEAGVVPVSSLTITFNSSAVNEGYVIESGKNSGMGSGVVQSSISAGDMSNGAQVKGMLSFDTSSIPDTARILSASLKIRRQANYGVNPFNTFGDCYVDIKGGAGFNGSITLEGADFQAAADATQVAVLSNAPSNLDYSTGSLDTVGISLIDKTGTTQFRVYFALNTNNDAVSDRINWYTSASSSVANRPVLEVTYDLGGIPATPANLTAAADGSQVLLNWSAFGDAASYKVKRATMSGGPYTTIVDDVTVSGYTDTGLTGGTTYYYVVSAVNIHGIESPDSNEAYVSLPQPVTAVFASVAAEDGWVLENGGTSSTLLRAGDHSNNIQFKAILSFDTSIIPDTATIHSVNLKLRRSGVNGANPFDSFGECYVDVKSSTGFNDSTVLEGADYQSPADATQVAVLTNAPNNLDWSIGSINTTGLEYINKAGTTQFRVYFELDSNNNGASEYINWYSGESSQNNQPVLEIVYQ